MTFGKVFYILGNKWGILQISIHFRQELVWRWVRSCGSRRLRVSVEFSGRPARFSVLYDLSLERWLQHWQHWEQYFSGTLPRALWLINSANESRSAGKAGLFLQWWVSSGALCEPCFDKTKLCTTVVNTSRWSSGGNGVWRTGLNILRLGLKQGGAPLSSVRSTKGQRYPHVTLSVLHCCSVGLPTLPAQVRSTSLAHKRVWE